RRLVDRAAARRNFVWIDMESSPYVDRTLHLFRQLRERSDRVGIALQAYLRPASVALPAKRDVDENFYRLSCRVLDDPAPKPGTELHIATHDPRLVDRLGSFIVSRRGHVPSYEYAMLYGIQRPLQE